MNYAPNILVDLPDLSSARLIVVGYAGRDEAAVRHHIEELAAIGVEPPPDVPMMYEFSPSLLTTSDEIVVAGTGSSGEVEPVLIRSDSHWFLTVGSDHTDRDLEREDIWLSKSTCPKPIAKKAVPLPIDSEQGGFDDSWDRCQVTSQADGMAYQAGNLNLLRTPSDIITRVLPMVSSSETLVIFGGTVPLLNGEFLSSSSFNAELAVGDFTIQLSYRIHSQNR